MPNLTKYIGKRSKYFRIWYHKLTGKMPWGLYQSVLDDPLLTPWARNDLIERMEVLDKRLAEMESEVSP